MNYRKIQIFTGQTFDVPNHIVRLDDDKGTHGWQVRYGPSWKLFSDHSPDGTGAEKALRDATNELAKRINTLYAPTGLRSVSLAKKSGNLPVGISGPKARLRKNRNTLEYEFQVTLPVYGEKPKNAVVYIGTGNTITDTRIEAALMKAIALREKYVKDFRSAATRSKREQAAKAGIVRACA